MNMPRILIVEDDVLIATGLANDLARSGITGARIALSGQEGLDAIRDERPDLVVLDIDLPGGMDGIEIAARIRSEYGLPFIYLTAYSNETLVDRAKETVPYGYILKPYRLAEICIAIDMALHRHEMERRIEQAHARLEREIEERKQTERLLRESEEKYRDMVEQINDVIYKVRKDGTILFVSGAVRQLFGYNPGDLEGRNFIDNIFEEDREKIIGEFGDVLAGTLFPSEYRIKTESGQVRWVRSSSRPYYENGVPAGLQGVMSDITLRKWAEVELRNSHERLTATFNALPDIMFEVDAEGCIHDFRAPENDLLYVQPEMFLGKKVREVLPEEAGRIIGAALDEAARTGRHRGAVYALPMRGGTRWFELSIASRGDATSPDFRLVTLARDVTERKNAEQAVASSEQRYRLLYENAPIGIFTTNSKGQALATNSAMARMLGLNTPEEAVAHYSDLGSQLYASAERRDEFLRLLREQGSVVGFEYEARTADGRSVWLSMNARVAESDDTGDILIEGFTADITKRKILDDELKESEQKLVAIVQGSPIPQFIIGTDHRVLYWNRAAENISGFKASSIVGTRDHWKAFYDLERPCMADLLIDKDTAAGITKWYPGICSESAQIPGAYDCIDFFPNLGVNGRWIHFTSALLRNTKGDIIGAVETLQDITDRKFAENALQDSERRYRELVENANSIILRMDEQGIVTFFNEFAETFFGFDRDEIIGRSVIGTIVPEVDSSGTDLARMIKGIAGDPDRYRYNENENMKKNGERVWVSWSNKVIEKDEDHVAEVLCIGTDITERRRAVEALRQTNHVVENSPVVLFRWKAAEGWPVEFVTNNVVQFGYVPEELMSGAVPFLFLIHPADRERVSREVTAHSESGADSFIQEYRIMTREGGIKWVDDRTVIERNPAGGVTGYQGIMIDITERKNAEQEVVRSEQRYRELYENLRDGSAEVDLDGNFIECNNRYLDMVGYSAEEMRRMTLRDISPKPDHEMEMKLLKEQVFVRGYSDIYEKELLRKDGTKFPVELQAYLKKRPDGEPAGYWALVRDISSRKKAEQELVKSEKKYRELADFMPEIIFEVDRRGALNYINRAVFPLLGYTIEETGRFNVLDFFVPEDRVRCRDNFIAVIKGATGGSGEYTLIRKDGTRLPVIMYNRAKVADGKRTGVRGVIVDITEIRRMETALRESEARFHSLFADSGDAQVLMDDWKAIDCNEAALMIMGCSNGDQLIGHAIDTFWPEVQPDGETSASKADRIIQRVLREKSSRFEWQYKRLDGSLFYGEVVLTAIFIEGRMLLHATLRDVTERRRLQDQIISIVDVEQQRLGQNLHDGLGQDLTGVAFLSNSLTRRLKELGLDEAARSEEVTRQVYRVITLVRTLSRELYPPNLVENEITYTLADFASNIEKTFGITCIFDQDRDLLITNLNTSTQIYYVTREAVNNAIRHGNARNILIKLTTDADRVNLIIKDDGAGLPPQTGESAGLGLKIMAYRMESIHGTFDIRRDTGSGTVITCTLPAYMTKKVE